MSRSCSNLKIFPWSLQHTEQILLSPWDQSGFQQMANSNWEIWRSFNEWTINKGGTRLKENQEGMANLPEASDSWKPLPFVGWRGKKSSSDQTFERGSREMDTQWESAVHAQGRNQRNKHPHLTLTPLSSSAGLPTDWIYSEFGNKSNSWSIHMAQPHVHMMDLIDRDRRELGSGGDIWKIPSKLPSSAQSLLPIHRIWKLDILLFVVYFILLLCITTEMLYVI